MDYERWQSELTTLITAILDEFKSVTEDDMEMFAVDFHPWHGTIALAFLTRSESEGGPSLRKASEMAAWKYYDFGAGLTSWRSAPGVASAMRVGYERAGEDRHDVAGRFFRACAAALASKPVQQALSQYRQAKGFGTTIPHPDTGEEYFLPG
jgi:hypothetical protein